MIKNNSVDVVIPTLNRNERINKTLTMLSKQELLPARVIVINQTDGVHGPEIEVEGMLRAVGVEVIWINRRNANLCGARNDAIMAATSPVCLFLDDDVIIPPDLVRQHADYLSSNPNIVALGGQVYHRSATSSLESMCLGSPERGTTRAFAKEGIVDEGPLFGGHFSIRRLNAIAIGGWDESFVGSANWEEGDLINRLRIARMPFCWSSDPWIIHLREISGGCRIPGNTTVAEWTKTVNFFLYKYRYPLDKSWLSVLKHALRAGPLRRENVVDPTSWWRAWSGFFLGWWRGARGASIRWDLHTRRAR